MNHIEIGSVYFLYKYKPADNSELVANKKIWAADEATLKRAENIINSEFSLVLEISPEYVPSFIEKTIGEKALLSS